jgi:hypothetical protein
MKTVTFKMPGGRTITGQVKNPQATLGAVAGRLAARHGLAGTFELVNKDGVTLDPNTQLESLPDEEVTLASELTPA